MKAAGLQVLEGRGVARPARDQLPLRLRREGRRRPRHLQDRRQGLAHQCGMSLTFMAKPDHTWVGSSCHIHSSLWRDGESAFAGETDTFKHYLAGQIALASERFAILRADDQLVQALRGRKLGADDACVGVRQPHVRLPHRRSRQGAARRDAAFRGGRESVSRVAPLAAGMYGIEHGPRSGPRQGNAYASHVVRFPHATPGDRAAREERRRADAAGRRGDRPLPQRRAYRAGASDEVVTGYERERMFERGEEPGANRRQVRVLQTNAAENCAFPKLGVSDASARRRHHHLRHRGRLGALDARRGADPVRLREGGRASRRPADARATERDGMDENTTRSTGSCSPAERPRPRLLRRDAARGDDGVARSGDEGGARLPSRDRPRHAGARDRPRHPGAERRARRRSRGSTWEVRRTIHRGVR